MTHESEIKTVYYKIPIGISIIVLTLILSIIMSLGASNIDSFLFIILCVGGVGLMILGREVEYVLGEAFSQKGSKESKK